MNKNNFGKRFAQPAKLVAAANHANNIKLEAGANTGKNADQVDHKATPPASDQTADSQTLTQVDQDNIHVPPAPPETPAPIEPAPELAVPPMPPPSPIQERPEITPTLNLEDSGFLQEVVHRDYAENQGGNTAPASGSGDTPENTPKEPAPNKFGLPKINKPSPTTPPSGDASAGEGGERAVPKIPEMTYQPPKPAEPDSLGGEIGKQVGMQASDWAFGILENFYPEVVAFFTKVDTSFIEKGNLPTSIEVELVQKVMAHNDKLRGRVKISEFHKNNILPPLKAIFARRGWEKSVPDEVMLVLGLLMLAADAFIKINAIRKENKVLVKDIRLMMDKHLGVLSLQDAQIKKQANELEEMKKLVMAMTAKGNQSTPVAA